MKKVIISICIMVSLMGVFVNVNASEDQEMITSNQVLEDGFLEETEEEEFLNFSTKVPDKYYPSNPAFKVKRIFKYGTQVHLSDANVIAHFATINYN